MGLKIKIGLVFFLFVSRFVIAQSPSIEWQKCFGGSNHENGTCVIQTFDGGFIALGSSNSNDGDLTNNHMYFDTISGLWWFTDDYWVVKTDASGNIQWQKSFGGSCDDYAGNIIQTSDSGYAIMGVSCSLDGDVTGNHGNSDLWLARLDNSGNITWQKSYGGPYDELLDPCVFQTLDSGFIIAGGTTGNGGDVSGYHGPFIGGDFWVVKINSAGNIEWQKCLGGTHVDYTTSIIQTFTGEYITAGYTASSDGDVTFNHGASDYWVVKLDSLGNIIWQKTYGGTINDQARQVVQALDSNYIIIGTTSSNNGDVTGLHSQYEDYWCVKIDTAGNLIWQKTLGGSGTEIGWSVDKTSDGGCIVAGKSTSSDGDITIHYGSAFDTDYWIAKLNSQGQLEWQKTLGGSDLDFAKYIKQTDDNGYIINGYTISNDSNVSGLHPDTLGTFISSDYWVVKLSAYTGLEENNFQKSGVLIYPNPSDGNFTIHFNGNTSEKTVQIFDVTGMVVFKYTLPSGINEQSLELPELGDGVYNCVITSGKERVSKKIAVINE